MAAEDMAQGVFRGFFGAQPSLGESQNVAASTGTGQTITLRRTTPPDTSDSRLPIQEFIRFWMGFSDTLTLTNVEIVPAETFGSRPGADIAYGQRREDLMDIDPNPTVNPPFIPSIGPVSPLDFSGVQHLSGAMDDQFPFTPDTADFDWPAFLSPPHLNPQPTRLSPPPAFSEASQPESVPIQHRGTGRRRRDAYPLFPGPHYTVPPDPVPSPPDGTRTCRACFDTLQTPIFLTCGHVYCQPCLNQLVSAGIANKMSWPPKCCTGRQGMDVEAIQTHLDEDILIRYVSVLEEYSTQNPVYCVNKVCSRHIEQNRIQNSVGKFVPCGQCGTVTCIECKQDQKQHVGDEKTSCRKLEELMNEGDRKLAKSNRWKQCPGCKNLVERTEGCDHMSCHCGTEFCYNCGTKRDPAAPGCVCDATMRRHMNRVRGVMRPAQRRAQAANNAPPADAAGSAPGNAPGSGFRTLMSRPVVPSSLPRLDIPTPPQSLPPPPPYLRNISESARSRLASLVGSSDEQRVENQGQARTTYPSNNFSSQGGDGDDKAGVRTRTPRTIYPNSRPIFAPSGNITPAVTSPDRTGTRLSGNRHSTAPFTDLESLVMAGSHDVGQSMPTNPYGSPSFSYPYPNARPGSRGGYAAADGTSSDNRRNERSAAYQTSSPPFYSRNPNAF